MKKKYLKLLLICICLFFLYCILKNNKLINNNIILAINLWVSKVFPSLFPMFVINDLLIYLDFPTLITKCLYKLTNKLKINTYAVYVFIMSIFSGTPSNAFILKKLVKNKNLNSEDASYILAFTFFTNPIFLFSMLNTTFSKQLTIKIIFIHYLANIIIYLFFHKKISNNNPSVNPKFINKTKISHTLNNSIKKSLDTLLMILGTITFYIIISTIIINCFNLNPFINTMIKGSLEITQGLNMLSSIKIKIKLKEIIAIIIISFGGLSIHSQIQNILEDTDISYKYFLIGRLLHIIISLAFVLLF